MAILALSFSAGGAFSYIGLAVAGLISGVFLLVLVRYGLLAVMSVIVFGVGLSNLPASLDASAWHVRNSWLAMAVFVAVAAYSFHLSLGGRSLFDDSDH